MKLRQAGSLSEGMARMGSSATATVSESAAAAASAADRCSAACSQRPRDGPEL